MIFSAELNRSSNNDIQGKVKTWTEMFPTIHFPNDAGKFRSHQQRRPVKYMHLGTWFNPAVEINGILVLGFYSLDLSVGTGRWFSGQSCCHEGMRTKVWTPRAHVNAKWMWRSTCNSSFGRQRQEVPEAIWLTGLATWASSFNSENPIQWTKWREIEDVSQHQSCRAPHAHMCTHTHVNMYTHTHNNSCENGKRKNAWIPYTVHI